MNIGLVMVECAKLDECNDLLMPKIHSMCLMVAWDPMEKLERLAFHLALTLPIHHYEVHFGHGHYLPTTEIQNFYNFTCM
jgi:hypothetical protein